MQLQGNTQLLFFNVNLKVIYLCKVIYDQFKNIISIVSIKISNIVLMQ
jgi:hypothetical protein